MSTDTPRPTGKTLLKVLLAAAILALLIGGFALEELSESAGFTTKHEKYVDENGALKETSEIVPKPKGARLKMASHFLIEFAASLIISILIVKRLEDNAAEEREEHLRSIQAKVYENVFDSLFKTTVPDEIYSVLKSKVINQTFVRKNANYIYDFDDQKIAGKILLRQTNQYELLNLRGSEATYDVKAVFDSVGGSTRPAQLKCSVDDAPTIELAIPPDLIFPKVRTELGENKAGVWIDEGEFIVVEARLKLPKGGTAEVTLVCTTVYENPELINDATLITMPTIGASLTANFPKGYEFKLFQGLSSPLKPSLTEEGRIIFNAKGGNLPGQGFIYTLRRKPSPPAAAPVRATETNGRAPDGAPKTDAPK